MAGEVWSVDPGKHEQYVACWEDGELVELAYGSSLTTDAQGPEKIVMEKMETRGAVNADLLDVTWQSCIWAGGFGCAVVAVRPSRWKGSVPKHIHHPRLLEKLSTEELRVLNDHFRTRKTSKKEQADFLDAVGIGLWCHER